MFLLDKGSQLLLYLYRERYTYTWLTVSSVSGPRTLLVKYNVYIAIYSWGEHDVFVSVSYFEGGESGSVIVCMAKTPV